MGGRRRSQGTRVKYVMIKAHRREFETAVMCRLLDVSRSGFYEWLRHPLSDRALEDERLFGLIRAAYTATVFSRVDRTVFWKLGHWLARKYRRGFPSLMREHVRAPEPGRATTWVLKGQNSRG